MFVYDTPVSHQHHSVAAHAQPVTHARPAAPAQPVPASSSGQPWRVVGLPQSVLAAVHGIPLVGDPKTIAMLIIGMTRMSGSVTETASIDAATHTIVFSKASDK